MTYTRIPLEKLEVARLRLRADLKALEQRTGKRYSIRTFYLGPRKKAFATGRTTNKADAVAAKLAVYEVLTDRSYEYTVLENYV